MTASPLIVLERALQVHHALERASIQHAVGGALALAYHVAEARATRDIDLNVAADPNNAQALFALLPADVPWSDQDARTVRETGQVRLLWPHPDGQPPIPLDLFFPQGEFHRQLNQRAVLVCMLDRTIPIISATDLMVLKMLFNRRKDWADIEELVRHGTPDVEEARRWLISIVGAHDIREQRLDELVTELA